MKIGRAEVGSSFLWKTVCRLALPVVLLYALPALAAVPDAPVMGIAAAAHGRTNVSFHAPVSDGGSPVTGYSVSSSPAGGVDRDSGSLSTRHSVTGLNNGTSYTFTVTATNADGSSAPSGPSNSVTPRPYAPSSGNLNNIVVFVRFSDQPEFSQPLAYYDNLFNSGSGSLKNFYLENSYHTLTVNSTFYPSSGASVVSYQDAHPTAYYQPYDAVTNTIGYQPGQSGARETALVTGIFSAIGGQLAASGLNFDQDGDGYLDHVCFEVFSTDAKPLPVLFYSRASYDFSGSVTVNGLRLGAYTWVTATQDYPDLNSPAIHEMGHSFGYPDLRNNAGRNPVGNWDVMSLGTPVHSGAYLKYLFTNWIADLPEITGYGSYTLNNLTLSTNNGYKIKLPNNEFLVLEYRKAAGSFESNLPGSGLCITRVKETAGIWGNLNGSPNFLYYFRPDGTLASDSPAANFFTCLNAESGRTQFNDFSNPACFLSDGSPCGISIANIGDTNGPSISFSVQDPAQTTLTHVISGYLALGGSRVSGATVTLSGDASGTVTTGNLGTYVFVVNDGGNYTVTPAKTNLVFSPVQISFSSVTGDRTQNFVGSNSTTTISGTVSSAGTALAGIPVYCNCTAGGPYSSPGSTDALGGYSFTVNSGGDCQVYPVKTNYFFTPNTKSFPAISTDQVQNFATYTASLTLSGTITSNGTPLAGVSVDCPGASSATPTTTDATGKYSFTVSVGNGAVYTVTPTSPSASFSPANKAYSGLVSNQVQNFATLPGTTTLLAASANPSVAGQSVTFNASVSGITPTGTVTFKDGTGVLCSAVPLSAGAASCASGALSRGSHSITALYSGDAGNAASTSAAVNQVVATVPGPPTSVSATAGDGSALVTFGAPVDDGGSAVTGYTVTGVPAGGTDSDAGSTALSHLVTGLANGTSYSFTVTAGNFAGTGAASTPSGSVTPSVPVVLPVSQTIGTITFSPASIAVGGSSTASAAASSGLSVSFSSTTPTVCSVSGAQVTALTAGTCTVAADQSGNGSYLAASQVRQNINVSQAGQSIGAIAFTPASIAVGGSSTASAAASSGLSVSFTSTTPAVCSVSGAQVTALTAGTCTVAADQSGNTNYLAASQVRQNINVSQAGQSIGAITFTPASIAVGGSSTASAAASSGLSVSFTSTTPAVCSVSGAQVTALTAGTCTVAADQSGNTNYLAASQVRQNINVSQAGQSIGAITFTPASIAVGGSSTASAAASSGLSVSFTSTTPAVCSVSGAQVTALTAGTCTVAADQSGNTNYLAASQIIGSLTVTPAPVTGTCGASNGLAVHLAPTGNLCASGTPTAVTGTGPWSWSCNGSNGGNNATCSATVLATPPGVVLGDLDGDGAVTLNDAVRSLHIAARLVTPTAGELITGDVAPVINGIPAPNGILDLADTIVILRKAVGLLQW